MKYKDRNFRGKCINIETNTRCTLQCHLCKRTTYTFYNKGIPFPGKDLTLTQFRKVIKYFNKVTFSGQLSDPIFGKHFIELLEICHKNNIKTCVNTAATGKPEKWYIEAFNANPNAVWTFGIDGMPEDSHKYRKNQDGHFLFEMMLLAKEMDLEVNWQYIIFPYNEADLENAKQWADIHDIFFYVIVSERNDDEGPRLENKEDFENKLIKRGNDLKKDKNSVLKPRCIYDDQQITLSSEGFFTPCCWLDDELYRVQPWVDTFFQSHLNIENNENIEDIFESKEWKDFWEMLINNPDNAPPVCYEYCASSKGDSERSINRDENFLVERRH